MKIKSNLSFVVIVLSLVLSLSIITALEDNSKDEAICSEQLELCVNEYNSLLEDFRMGVNCNSTTFETLKHFNGEVTKERDNLREEILNLKNYKGGFYALLLICLLITIILFRQRLKLNKYQGNKNNAR